MGGPNVAVVNCKIVGPDGKPLTVIRPMTDEELAQLNAARAKEKS